ncbi:MULTISPECIES: transposase [unclassified Thiocapsa]|uniref:transposase n=1 Tax=unclassified Thiocapsa TaxID=2641286 RepID=UPI0035AEDD7C
MFAQQPDDTFGLGRAKQISEVYHMLAENLETWTDQWKREGLEQGLEQGSEQGREAPRHILVRQVRRRFGPTIAEQTQPLLARIADLQTLEDLGDQLLISPDGDDWLQAVRTMGVGDEH